jgi:hypothetical protein
VARGRGGNNHTPSGHEIKNSWSCTSTVPVVAYNSQVQIHLTLCTLCSTLQFTCGSSVYSLGYVMDDWETWNRFPTGSHDRLWCPPILFFSRCWGLYFWDLAYRALQFTIFLCLAPNLRMRGAIPPYAWWDTTLFIDINMSSQWAWIVMFVNTLTRWKHLCTEYVKIQFVPYC